MNPRVLYFSKRIIRSALFIAVVVYGLLFIGQRELMFPAWQANRNIWKTPEEWKLKDFSQVTITAEDNVKVILWYRQADTGKPTILFFHGNADLVSNLVPYFHEWAGQGYGVAALSYRGYGPSEGSPSEVGIYKDAAAAIKFLQERGVKQQDIVLYGRSIGTGVATEMAIRITPRALVLVSPYTSMPDMTAIVYPWLPGGKYLVRDHLDSLSKAKSIKVPVLIMHGRKDELIPFNMAEQLFNEFTGPKRIEFFDDGTHNDLPFDKMATALDQFIHDFPAE